MFYISYFVIIIVLSLLLLRDTNSDHKTVQILD